MIIRNIKYYFALCSRKVAICVAMLVAVAFAAKSQNEARVRNALSDSLNASFQVGPQMKVKGIKVNDASKSINITLSKKAAELHLSPAMIDSMQLVALRVVDSAYQHYQINYFIGTQRAEQLVSRIYSDLRSTKNRKNAAAVTVVAHDDRPYKINKGLVGRNIALWQSHGLYYDQACDRWHWQRARVQTTVEDRYTLSYVLPYLMPMLQRAGATVWLPRERDCQEVEIIVDNDQTSYTSGTYNERTAASAFFTPGHSGFAYKKESYQHGENPFADGTCRAVETRRTADAFVEWEFEVPVTGDYWVSITYAHHANAATDAHYMVKHSAGATHFTVNQQKAAGTWVYLDKFTFLAGEKYTITLSNASSQKGYVVADAVRIGGGVGNIARRPATKTEQVQAPKNMQGRYISAFEIPTARTSGVLRLWEAAPYWLQWAGAPYSVYSYSHSMNDYLDDYTSRALWVNWLNAGSCNNPDSTGLGVPIDAALAFHSDAGVQADSVVGTLSIYTSKGKTPFVNRYPSGESRSCGRDLADVVGAQILNDLRATIAPEWRSRGVIDKNYFESCATQVPTMILELLSHQNYEDMRYGLNPEFKFLVSRAVYKALLKFIAYQTDKEYIVAPLPVKNLSAVLTGDSVMVRWQPRLDPLDSTAVPTAYVLYSRVDSAGWDAGTLVRDTFAVLPIVEGVHTRYKVTAVNDGGESADSEIAAAYKAYQSRGEALIVNNFDRVAAPDGFAAGDYAGFAPWLDSGIGDGCNYAYCGEVVDFNMNSEWISDDACGFGASSSRYDFDIIAANTHDYAAVHGRAIAACGYSYSTVAAGALDSIESKYAFVDLICGAQRATFLPHNDAPRYTVFTPNLQKVLSNYAQRAGALLATGAYIVSDSHNIAPSVATRNFIKNVFGAQWRASAACDNGKVCAVFAPNTSFSGNYTFASQPNSKIYAVARPDALVPAVENSYTIMRYAQNSTSAAVAYAKNHRAIACGFPFECIVDSDERNQLMLQFIKFLCP